MKNLGAKVSRRFTGLWASVPPPVTCVGDFRIREKDTRDFEVAVEGQC